MRFDPEALPELRKSPNPAERKHDAFAARADLMTRSPLAPEEWVERYENAFFDLSWRHEMFRDLMTERTPPNLVKLQELLDAWSAD